MCQKLCKCAGGAHVLPATFGKMCRDSLQVHGIGATRDFALNYNALGACRRHRQEQPLSEFFTFSSRSKLGALPNLLHLNGFLQWYIFCI